MILAGHYTGVAQPDPGLEPPAVPRYARSELPVLSGAGHRGVSRSVETG